MGKLNNMKNNISYFIKKNIFIVLMLISLCPVLAISYAKFTINSESYRSNEMYISELLYSIKIDNENTYTIDIEPGETEHIIEITSLNAISTNYKLAYLNNNNLEVKYASDYLEPSFGGILTKRTISLTIKNTSTEKQTLSLMVFGGYSFNDVEEVKVLDTYTEIKNDYWKYDYETTALYIDNQRVEELNPNMKYTLSNYTCTNDATVTYDTINRIINIKSDKQTKCNLYFKESPYSYLSNYIIDNYNTLGLTKIDQTATGNLDYNNTEYRYQGKTPNNYITFNGETGVWRIIGVFEVETLQSDKTYTKEYKVKIIRDSIGTSYWNTAASNNWVSSSLKDMLNIGDYYNRSGSYTSTGLLEASKNQISTTKWFLGNAPAGTTYGNARVTFTQERSTNTWSGNSQTWNGKVGLIYPSDYMYASSGCYNDSTVNGNNYGLDKCTTTNWLIYSTIYWTISPHTYTAATARTVVYTGAANASFVNEYSYDIRPSIYLDPNVNYITGTGTINDPFIIK